MKLKLMSLLAVLILLLSCGTTTTTTTTSNNAAFSVPATITTSFTTQYPTATNVTWTAYDMSAAPIVDWEFLGWQTMDANDYVVRFDMDGQNYYGWYDDSGNWIGTAYVINAYNTLPAAVANALNTKFPGYSFESAQREFWKDQMAYEVKLKKTDDDKVKVLMDANGNILKQKNKD